MVMSSKTLRSRRTRCLTEAGSVLRHLCHLTLKLDTKLVHHLESRRLPLPAKETVVCPGALCACMQKLRKALTLGVWSMVG